jgi:HEAT repeat protein
MRRVFLVLAIVPIPTLWAAAPVPASPASAARAWSILEQGLTSKNAAKRANAVHALRLLPHSPRAQETVERAVADPNPNVRAAAARALGPMEAVSSVPRLKGLLNDGAPNVVLAAAHSLYLLGERAEVYDVDLELLTGERKSADGFVKTQINELHNPRVVATMGFETGIGFVPFGGEAYEVFKRASKDDRTPVRVAAVKELATDPDPKIDAALTRACSDKKWLVRAAAIYAIAKKDDAALLSAITPALQDKKDVVRYEAAAAVVRLSGVKPQPVNEANK